MCQIVSGRRFWGPWLCPVRNSSDRNQGQPVSTEVRNTVILCSWLDSFYWSFLLQKDAQDVLWFSNISPVFRMNFEPYLEPSRIRDIQQSKLQLDFSDSDEERIEVCFFRNCLHPLHRECYDQDMAPRISIRIVIWILLSLVTISISPGGQLYSSHTSYSPLGQSTAGHSPTKPCFPNGFDLKWDWVRLRLNLLTTFYKEISTGQQKINCSRCTGSAGYHLLSLHYVANLMI